MVDTSLPMHLETWAWEEVTMSPSSSAPLACTIFLQLETIKYLWNKLNGGKHGIKPYLDILQRGPGVDSSRAPLSLLFLQTQTKET